MNIEDLLGRDAVREGHFVDDNWHHTGRYIDTSGVARSPTVRARVVQAMAMEVLRSNARTVVALPEARELGQALGDYLQTYEPRTQNVYGALVDGAYQFPYSFRDAVADNRVLIVAPVVNDVERLVRMADACRALGATPRKIVAVVCLVEGLAEVSGVPVFAPVRMTVPKHVVGSCPLCRMDVPVDEDFGLGRAFVRSREERAIIHT